MCISLEFCTKLYHILITFPHRSLLTALLINPVSLNKIMSKSAYSLVGSMMHCSRKLPQMSQLILQTIFANLICAVCRNITVSLICALPSLQAFPLWQNHKMVTAGCIHLMSILPLYKIFINFSNAVCHWSL